MPNASLEQVQRDLARRFVDAGIETSMLDARLLVCAASGFTPEQLIMEQATPISAVALGKIRGWEAARCAGVPVSRLVGSRAFFGLNFDIGPAVLDPRPDTETLVNVALVLLEKQGPDADVLDLGTGSGCVLISLLDRMPALRGLGVAISARALRIARRNAHIHKVRDRLGLRQGRWFAPVRERCALIVSNPPYIVRAEIDHLATDVRDHDPRIALDGGVDGLDAYREICMRAPLYLKAGGHIALEIGYDQAGSVSGIMRAQGFSNVDVTTDLEGRARVVSGQIKKTQKGV